MRFYVDDFNGVWEGIVPRNQTVRHWDDCDVFLSWNDIIDPDFKRSLQAKGKRVVVLQHGWGAMNDYHFPYSRPLIADHYLCWGRVDMLRLRQLHCDRGTLVGCPLLQRLKPRRDPGYKQVVFVPAHGYGVPESYAIFEELYDLNDLSVNIVAKILDVDHDAEAFRKISAQVVVSNRSKPGHIESIADVLETAACVVTMQHGTFSLLAMSLDIPVIVIDLLGDRYRTEQLDPVLKQTPTDDGAWTVRKLEDLNPTVDEALANPGHLMTERRATAMWEGGADLDAIGNIVQFLRRLK